MELLERASALADLTDALAAARSGRGRVVLLGGGAGIGKTSAVVTLFTGPAPTGPGWGAGAIELPDPARVRAVARRRPAGRPLGRLRSGRAGPERSSPRCWTRSRARAAAPPGGRRGGRALGRRGHPGLAGVPRPAARRLPALLLLTYRDDEMPIVAPLRRVLGGLRAPATVRIALPPLSAEAVGRLAGPRGAGRGCTPDRWEPVLRHRAARHRRRGLPVSVSQAVLARVARLPQPTRELLYLLAVVPARAEAALLDAVCPGWTDASRPPRSGGWWRRGRGSGVPARAGPPRRRGGAAGFAGPGAARPRPGGAAAAAATRRGSCTTRSAPGTTTRSSRWRPAARAAAAAGAHREATAHYRRALRLAERYDVAERAELLEAFTVEASTTCRIGEALRAAERALALREEQGDPTGGDATSIG